MTPVDWQRIDRIIAEHRFVPSLTEWRCSCNLLLAGRLTQFDFQTITSNEAEARESHDEHLRTLIDQMENDDGN